MRFWRFSAAGLVLATVLALSIGSAHGQTTGLGPYYPIPSWDQKISPSTRFLVLSNWSGQAVLDRETGLVWERSPSTAVFTWFDAQTHCNTLSKGTRKGWRLPTLQELASLVNPSIPPPGPVLPTGHPFRNVRAGWYWSATSRARESSQDLAWTVFFVNGDMSGSSRGGTAMFAWCVRGGQGVDPQ